MINRGELFHISARPDDERWDGMQYFDSKSGKGIVFAFRGAKAGEESHSFKLKGLARTTDYEVWSEDGSVSRSQASGAKLMDEGLGVRLKMAGASELIFIQTK